MNTVDDENLKFAERLNSIFDALGYEERGRAQRIVKETKLDISDRAVNKWLKGDSKPTLANIQAIAERYNQDFNWLAVGMKGRNKIAHGVDNPHQKCDEDGVQNSESDIKIPEGTSRVVFDKSKEGEIPVISWVAAGSFSEVMPVTIDDVVEWIPRPRHLSASSFGLIIQGRSMYPEFKPGEIIYVEPEITQWDLKDGDLVVIHCNDDNQATFKQLVIGDSPDDMYLKPLNPDWPEQKMVPMGECSLVGIVDGKYTRFRR